VTVTDDKTERVDIPPDVELEAPFSLSEALTPVPPRTPSMCWRCPSTAAFLSAAAPAPRCGQDARDHFDACSVANDLSWAICVATFMLRFGRFEFYVGPERRAARTLPPLTLQRRPGPPPLPPSEDDR